MSIKTVIMLVPDNRLVASGCRSCIYKHTPSGTGCSYWEKHKGVQATDCITFEGHYAKVVQASVSRNKREGKFQPELKHFYWREMLTRTGRARYA